ncbi:glutathione S-transferase family protein [Thiomicrorhabdus heinhorstiae]|uniref:glutathione transferase n=1 Tax=Thiomicrorhabdus heinhorstiae TaxID=2748010 RepID=A0ABS0BSE3_9GAMM|nr:glutathione S-transferase family protein [Thiomicrorhabdus heinhorstiae]MBF6056787.1 glutathione S-transferase family protein [Thiomicrorhabdus heinhorstiae]
MQSKLELVSFKLCPFVQRAVIVLKQKGVDFDITYIDLNDPPEWFKAISPLGQVPILKADGEVLFESAVIQEFVDEITPPSLHPQDPLIKAKHRAWMSFSSEIIFAAHGVVTAKEEGEFEQKQVAVKEKLARLEGVHSGGDYFAGDQLHLIDTTIAPLFMRLDFIKQLCGIDLLLGLPKCKHWSEVLLAMPAVQESVVPDLMEMYRMMIVKMDGILATKLNDG